MKKSKKLEKLKITEKSFQTIDDANNFVAKFTDDDTIESILEKAKEELT